MSRVIRCWALALALLPWLVPPSSAAQARVPNGFPHARHNALFPVCEGCHAGIPNGDAQSAYPSPADCVRCHDGTRAVRIAWRGATPRASNLAFSHPRHDVESARAGESPACQGCHAIQGASTRMNVAGPDPQRCVGCHAHAGGPHPARAAPCAKCHRSLVQSTTLSIEQVSRFPRPAWHDSGGFASTHGRDATARAASCATCHARESCERCHPNADRMTQVQALGRDERVLALLRGKAPAYPEPPSHKDEGWRRAHGPDARSSIATCANCHTREGCVGCHREAGATSAAAISLLPLAGTRQLGVAPRLMASAVHTPDIGTRHGRLAATGSLTCAECHAQRSCTTCHAAADSRAFHAANFVERHAVEVFANGSDCQSCHNTQRFCRTCHASAGVAADSRINAAFHTGKPMWVLSHGQAARLGMESCASCHKQNDCIRCHSASGGWGVNPHGRGFPANALAARNRSSCRWCHTTLPSGGS